MKKTKVVLIILILIFGLLSTLNVWAQTPSTQSARNQNENLESLKKLVQEIKEKNKIKVYAGTIKGILGTSINLETKNGNKIVKIDNQTRITFDSPSKEPKLENILVDQFAIALGELDQSKIMTAKTLQIFSSQPLVKRKAIFGIIKSVDHESIVIVHQIKGEETKINFSPQTKIKTAQGELKIADLKIGGKVAIVGTLNDSGEMSAIKVLFIPKDFSNLIKKFENKSTDSANQPSTSSAKH